MENRLDSKLFERVKAASKRLTGKTYGIASAIGVNELTFKGYCSESREGNLWPLLPVILAAFPKISREWLYFNEGEMFVAESTPESSPDHPEMRGKLRLHPGYHYDPLGRIEMLTNVRGSIAAELQAVFGVDLKELKPFVARYNNARQAWDAWRAAGSREEDVPDVELPQIPEDWLDYFWRHYGPSTSWIVYGDGQGAGEALVKPRPGMAETERLRGELAAIKEETQRLRDEVGWLRQALADAREKNARLEAILEERTQPDKNERNRAPSPPAANSMQPGRK